MVNFREARLNLQKARKVNVWERTSLDIARPTCCGAAPALVDAAALPRAQTFTRPLLTHLYPEHKT